MKWCYEINVIDRCEINNDNKDNQHRSRRISHKEDIEHFIITKK